MAATLSYRLEIRYYPTGIPSGKYNIITTFSLTETQYTALISSSKLLTIILSSNVESDTLTTLFDVTLHV